MMDKLIPVKIKGKFIEAKHHKIAAQLKAMSDKWDEIEKSTSVRPPEAYDYSFGLVMGELIFFSLKKDVATLRQKILTVKGEMM